MDLDATILVVDDDTSVRELIHDFLCAVGYKVITEDNPVSGLERIKQNSYDLVITDLMMPGLSGMDFLKSVKAYDADMPVVMITAHPSIDIAIKAIKEGASDFITKPFNLAHARLVVRRAIEEGRLKRQNRDLKSKVEEKDNIGKVLQDKVKELSALYTISEALHHPATTKELFEKVIEMAISISEAKRAGLWVLDREDGRVTLRAAANMENLLNESFSITDAGLVGKVFVEKRYFISKDYKDCICGGGRRDFKHPFLCAPILIGNQPFGALQVCQKVGGADFTDDDRSLLISLAEKASLRIENLALYENLIDNMLKGITALIRAIDARDNYTMNHCKRVTSYAIKIAELLDCPEEIKDALRFAGPLHDVGKIGIRDAILLKPAALNLEEFMIMKSHTTIGEEIVRPLNLGELERAIVRNHHERFDGKGYPDGLKGVEIPLVARLFAVADTYDAMTTNRPYRPARSHEEAVAELKRCRWTQFDGDIVDVFVRHDICKE